MQSDSGGYSSREKGRVAMRQYCNNEWKFSPDFKEEMIQLGYGEEGMEEIRIPHTVAEMPYSYFDEHIYQMVSGYRHHFFVEKDWEGKVLLLTFDGVAHEKTVYINGKEVGKHSCGYTAFTIDITNYVNYGQKNVIVLKVDSKEDLNIPPFGYVIDYMTYGGIYRDVYLEVKEPEYIEDIFYHSSLNYPMGATLEGHFTFSDNVAQKDTNLKIALKLPERETPLYAWDKEVKENTLDVKEDLSGIIYWDVDNPQLYEIISELWVEGKMTDRQVHNLGFREAIFKKDGFYLNGKKLRIRGLNRHQSYPYIGYAATASLQKMDARILKHELGLNAVRTSHYPQSHYFLEECDRLGLLVFTEMPGWQHIGNEVWKEQAVKNVEEMILQYRNHPSIILWGVRINESQDDDAFYTKTNDVAHSLDPTRQTGGVRAIKKSHLLEDVYTYNDFVHNGDKPGCEPKKKVTSNMDKAYLVSEYNGHMYPTKNYDCEEHRLEHALRHARVLNDVSGEEDICGSFGWCMADYNTHKDFGSGDRVCHHGVLDMYRNPKLAAAVYESQQEEAPVLKISSSMDIGEHPGGNLGKVYLFTNADSVKLYKNEEFIAEFFKEETEYGNLVHGPIRMNDLIGDSLVRIEHYPAGKAKVLKKALNDVATYGLDRLPKKTVLSIVGAALRYGMNFEDAYELYGKYIGNWGKSTTTYRFEAIKDGQVVASVTKKPMTEMKLWAEADHYKLQDGDTYDMAAIRVRAVDENGNILYYCNEPVSVKAEGPIEIVGPKTFGLKGGMGGTYIKTLSQEGKAAVTLSLHGANDIRIEFEVTR